MKNEKKTIGCTDSATAAQRPSSTITKRTMSSHVSFDRSRTNKISIDDHRTYLNQQIKSWWEKHRTDYNLDDHILTQPDDYQLIINEDSAIFKCSCKQKVNLPLPRERKHYQLSNFYKHLTRSDRCTVIKTKCLAFEEEDEDIESSNDIPSDSPSDCLADVPTRTNDQPPKRSADGSSKSLPEAKRLR